MDIEISRREVLNNLIRFKDNLLEMRLEKGLHLAKRRKREEEKKEIHARSYKVLLNRHTGDMRFAQKISSLESRLHKRGQTKAQPEDWKEIRISVNQDAEGTHFEAVDAYDRTLRPEGLDPLAWAIAKETIDVLNRKGKEVKNEDSQALPEEIVLLDLSSIHLGLQKESIGTLPGWFGPISRIEAEKILTGQPEGTYLLREADAMTADVALNLSKTNHLEIEPYILTLVENEQKISDILLLKTMKGWILYEDDPDLKDPFYRFHPTPSSLIHSLKSRARHPFVHKTRGKAA